jgi:hypothetical protein
MTPRQFRTAGQPRPEKPPKLPPFPILNRPPVRRKPALLARAEVPKE